MKRRRLIFHHDFTTGQRARCSIRGLKSRLRIDWLAGHPDKHVLAEYREWMHSVVQTAADYFGGSILYCDGDTAVVFAPQKKGTPPQ